MDYYDQYLDEELIKLAKRNSFFLQPIEGL